MKVAMPILLRSTTRLKVSSSRFTITYSVPKEMGISLSRPLISDWKGSTPSAAILNAPTLTAQIITPDSDMRILLVFISLPLSQRKMRPAGFCRTCRAYYSIAMAE